MKDIQFKSDEGMFNCRVVGVCIKKNKIFLSKLKSDHYWSFVGGKVAFGESTDVAVVREYQEEVGVVLQVDHLTAVIENFFNVNGQPWHEYIFFYQLRDDNDVLEFFEGERQVADNKEAIYKWFDLSELKNVPIKPDCSLDAIKNISQCTQHYINREN